MQMVGIDNCLMTKKASSRAFVLKRSAALQGILPSSERCHYFVESPNVRRSSTQFDGGAKRSTNVSELRWAATA